MDDILLHPPRHPDPKASRVVLMDFKISPANPDGICVRAEFWVETWEDLATLMERLQHAEAEV